MPKFRKKPVVIEATQWFPGVVIEGVREVGPSGTDTYPVFSHRQGEIETLEGTMYVQLGDWVITGVKGERYPCKPDIFAVTYEPVE